MRNKPEEAVEFLESAVSEDPAHVQAFLYLGIAYLQLNRPDDAIAAYTKILPRGGAETPRIAYNLGNAYFAKGSNTQGNNAQNYFELARQYYTQAVASDPTYAPAYLNRANALVKSGDLGDALTDYERYLSLAPDSSQRGQVERIMAFIREEFAAAERRRGTAEDAARTETDRRQRLLQEVTESLRFAAEDSRGLSAGTEDARSY